METTMETYWFELLDEDFHDLGIAIKDGDNVGVAIDEAKRRMRECGITYAELSVNSMETNDFLYFISIEIE